MKAYYFENSTGNFFIEDLHYKINKHWCKCYRVALAINPSTMDFIRACERRVSKGKFVPRTWVYWVVLDNDEMKLKL